MANIQITNMNFTYDGSYTPVFEGVNLVLDTDWKLGLIGRNGRGKTTLLKLLMGEFEYSGDVFTPFPFDYFPPKINNPAAFVYDIAEKIIPSIEEWRIKKELSLLDLDEDIFYREFSSLSGGERTKVLLAILFLQDHRFLLIDEPTNHLDKEGRRIVMEYLKQKSGFIIVSHDSYFLDGCVDHILSINKKNIDLQAGNFSTWMLNKDREDQFELNENEKLLKDISRLDKAAKRSTSWSHAGESEKFGSRAGGLSTDRGFLGAKAARVMKRAKQVEKRRDKALGDKTKLLKNIERADDLSLNALEFDKNRLLYLRDFAIVYDGKLLFAELNLSLERGDKLAVEGGNGSGKSSLIKAIAREKLEFTGEMQVSSGVKISYLPQDTSALAGSLDSWISEQKLDENLFKTLMIKLDFPAIAFEKDMIDYSEGQKKKIYLATSIAKPAHLYLWDEPLNYIDIWSRRQVLEICSSEKMTMIFIEHDRDFSDSIANKRITI